MDSYWTDNLVVRNEETMFYYSNIYTYKDEEDAINWSNYYAMVLLEDLGSIKVTNYVYDKDAFEIEITASSPDHNNTAKVNFEGSLLDSPRLARYYVEYIRMGKTHNSIFKII